MINKNFKKVLGVTLGVAMAMALVVGFAVKDKTSANASPSSKVSVKDCTITLSQDSFDYTGQAIEPEVKVTYQGQDLQVGADYDVKYKDNIDAGTAKVVVKGKNNYKSSVTAKFTIKGVDIEKDCNIIVGGKTVTVFYNNQPLLRDRDYGVHMSSTKKLVKQEPVNGGYNNTYVETTYYTISGKGQFSGNVLKTDSAYVVQFEAN